MANTRKIVLQALLRVENEGAYSNLVWNTAVEQSGMDSRDIPFATSLFYGVLERAITLDFVLSAHSKTPVKKMDSLVKTVLRMGVYQMLYMDSIPVHAAINESVVLVKKSKFSRLSGFVNGVLRSVSRTSGFPDMSGLTKLRQLSVTYSLPESLVAHYINSYGEPLTEELLPGFVGGRPAFLRVNTCKTTPLQLQQQLSQEGVESTVFEPLANTLMVQSGGNLVKTNCYQQGLFHVQDPASGYCCQALDVRPGMRVLDVCAAPGGKTFTLAQTMNNQGEIVSCDLYEQKIGLIQTGAQRLGLTCVNAMQNDAGVYNPNLGLFDRVLCDLPCSGLGVLGRKPEIRYKIDTFLDNFPDLQYGMLCECIRYVKPGGVLVFSTCTLNPAENEENVKRLLSQHEDLQPYPILPELERRPGEESHFVTLFPHVHQTDGFFVSAVRKG